MSFLRDGGYPPPRRPTGGGTRVARPPLMGTLLDELGGRDAMEIVVVGLCERVMSAPELSPFFCDVSRVRYEARLVEYLCALLGDRPASWSGRDLRAVHAELAISAPQFARFVDLLAQTLAAAGVSPRLSALVRARIETIRDHVVAAPAAPAAGGAP